MRPGEGRIRFLKGETVRLGRRMLMDASGIGMEWLVSLRTGIF